MAFEFDKKKITKLLHLLNDELSKKKIRGELYLVGGAVMCLLFHDRKATRDLDGLFVPKKYFQPIIHKIAHDKGLPHSWLNDGVKGYLSQSGTFNSFLDLDHLKIFAADPHYLLAMKCLAMRIGPEFNDEADIRYLLRHLNIETYDAALKVIEQYYPLDQFPAKSFYALEEILGV